MADESQPSLRELLEERGPSLKEVLRERDPNRQHMTLYVGHERRATGKKKPEKVIACEPKQQAG